MASTQTVILLAEMASDSNELDMATQNSTEGQEGRNNRTVHFTLPQNEQQCKEPTEELGFVPEEAGFSFVTLKKHAWLLL